MITDAITGLCIFMDHMTPYSINDSKFFAGYHRFKLARQRAVPNQNVPSIQRENANREDVQYLTQNYLKPLVIRASGRAKAATNPLAKAGWWLERYGQDRVLAATPSGRKLLTLDAFFKGVGESYVPGTSAILARHPDLRAALSDPLMEALAPNRDMPRGSIEQLFMGSSHEGMVIHAEIGTNIFRQVTGKKKWVLIPPSQTTLVYPHLRPNGFVAVSKTVQKNEMNDGVSWFNKLERYTVELNPGDILIVPSWWWHGVESCPADGEDVVVSYCTRHTTPQQAFRAEKVMTLLAGWRRRFGGLPFDMEADPEGLLRLEESLVKGINSNPYGELTLSANA